jgi:hypothetical protein
MQVNLRRIDDRIQKLQEIRRIAADPELVAMLVEFMSTEDERKETAPAAKADTVVAPIQDDAELVTQILKGSDSQGTGLWSRKRA